MIDGKMKGRTLAMVSSPKVGIMYIYHGSNISIDICYGTESVTYCILESAHTEKSYGFLNIGCVILILNTVLSENVMRVVYV